MQNTKRHLMQLQLKSHNLKEEQKLAILGNVNDYIQEMGT